MPLFKNEADYDDAIETGRFTSGEASIYESEEAYLAALDAGNSTAMLLEEGQRAVDSLGHTVSNIGMANSFGMSLEDVESHMGASPFSSADFDINDLW